jgi:Asp-tRNA(Asn)/Glu-tRNA(Gln) amidotransferase C subunit
MRGVRVLLDEATNKRIIQIDVEEVDPNDEMLEDVIDIILAEDARDDEKFDWEDVKKVLKAEGKL